MKAGLWTQHSTRDGRTFYFNMAHNQSYWELPHELQIEAGIVGADDDDPPVLTSASPRRVVNQESSSKTRLAALATGRDNGLEAKQRKTVVSTFDLLQSRLTEATRQYKHKSRAAPVSDVRTPPPPPTIDSTSQDYLATVRGLEQKDQNGTGTDGKWLSR